MRKLKTRQTKERENRLKGVIVAVVVIVLLFSSIIGYAIFSGEGTGDTNTNTDEQVDYGGIIFNKQSNGYWIAVISGYQFATQYNPTEIQDIEIDSGFEINLNNYNNKPLYFVSEEQEPVNEIIQNIALFVQRYQYACLEGQECTNDELPVKNCTENMIIIKESTNTRIYQQDNCAFIEYSEQEQIRASDAFVFKILGII